MTEINLEIIKLLEILMKWKNEKQPPIFGLFSRLNTSKIW